MLFHALLFPLCTFECVERETRGCKGIFGIYNDYNLNDEMNVLNFTVVSLSLLNVRILLSKILFLIFLLDIYMLKLLFSVMKM